MFYAGPVRAAALAGHTSILMRTHACLLARNDQRVSRTCRGGVADVSRGSCARCLQGVVATRCRTSLSQACAAHARVYSRAVTDGCRGRVAGVSRTCRGDRAHVTVKVPACACAPLRRRTRGTNKALACARAPLHRRARATFVSSGSNSNSSSKSCSISASVHVRVASFGASSSSSSSSGSRYAC